MQLNSRFAREIIITSEMDHLSKIRIKLYSLIWGSGG